MRQHFALCRGRHALTSVIRAQPARHGTAVELVVVAIAFVGISVSSALTQRIERLYADAQIYQTVAVQFFESKIPITAQVPWAYRVATPWLAAMLRPVVARALPDLDAKVEDASGMLGVTPFLVINIVASAVATLLLLLYLRRFVDSSIVRIVLVIAWVATWHAPVRWAYFYPANVDALFMVFLIAGLLIIEAWRGRSPVAAAFLLAPVVFAGTLVREAMVLVPIAFGIAQMDAARRDRRTERLVASAVPIIAMVLAWLFVRSIVTPVGHQQWAEVGTILRNKPIWTWVLGWFFTFGPPVIALIVAGRMEVWAFLRSRPEIGGHVAACGVLGYIAGTGSDTERLLAWAAPAMYVLAGHAIAARRFVLARMPLLLALLVVVEIASSRVLWAIPVGVDRAKPFTSLEPSWSALLAIADKFLVIHNYYSNLWSFFGSRPVHAATLAFDLALTVGVAAWINRAWQRHTSTSPTTAVPGSREAIRA